MSDGIEVEDISDRHCSTCEDGDDTATLARIDDEWICVGCLIAEVMDAREARNRYLECLSDDFARSAMQALAPTTPDAQELAVRAYEIAAAMMDEREGGE
jgi:hypothetical protein